MQAIVYTRYGPPEVAELRDVPRPEPGEHQVLVKVAAASLNALDFRRFESLSAVSRILETRVLKTVGTVLGGDIAGTVEAVGAAVNQLQPGDEVYGVSAGLRGGFAEYACANEDQVALKPSNLPFEDAAAVPVAALTALLSLLDRGRVRAGQRVLIAGASGGVGSFAVQIAKAFGAEVTAVRSTRNLELARSLGADEVIDYTQADFSRLGKRYDLIVAVNGSHSMSAYARALSSGGTCVVVGGSLRQIFGAMLFGPLVSAASRKKIGMMGIAKVNHADLLTLKQLIEMGRVVPAIDRRYRLDQVADALRYLVTEHARGKVVLVV